MEGLTPIENYDPVTGLGPLETLDLSNWKTWRETAARETAALAEANAADEPVDVDREQWVLRFDDVRPPLTANQRLHWREIAERKRILRNGASFRAKAARIPALERCEVLLIWVVARADRRRDADNIVNTLKPMADGLVDAGIVPDDTPDLMVKPMPRIELRRGETPHLELIVTRLPALEPADGMPLAVVEAAIAPKRTGKPARRTATAAALLDFERENPGNPAKGSKYNDIRDLFGMKPPVYIDRLLAAAASREGLEHDAITAHAITDRAAALYADRARRILGKDPSA